MEPDIPDGLTPEARRERERFLRAYQARMDEARQVSLSILVWGPDPRRSSPVSRKRSRIREELRKLGHNAMFSEELSHLFAAVSEKSKEFAQSLVAHLVIILIEGSPGALAEAHDFCNDPEIAPKVYLMAPR